MKRAKTYIDGAFEILDLISDNSPKHMTDKLYKLILIDNYGNISTIKAIKKASNKNKREIVFNIFTSNKKEIEKNIKLFNGIIIIYNSFDKEFFSNLYEFIHKIEKNLIKDKFFPKIIIGDKQDYLNSLNMKNKDRKYLNKIKNIKFIEPVGESNGTIKKAVEEIIKIKNIQDKYDNYINDNIINEKYIINKFNKSKINLLKCSNCNQPYEISIINNANFIDIYCNKCDFKSKFDIMDFDKFINDKNCFECRKKIMENGQNNYCFICKKNICDDCVKKHLQKEDKDSIKINNIIYPNNLIDLFCNKHDKISYNYCVDCQKSICTECEIEFHSNHSTQMFDYNKICNLVMKQKKNLDLEKQKFEKIKNIVEDCINSLKKLFDKFILNKEKEIYYKEKIIKELELFKFDNILIENTKNLKFTNYDTSIYSFKDSWEKKLINIFEFFNEPIKIEKTKLILKDNLKGPFDILQDIDISLHGATFNNEKVTDLCPLHEYKSKQHFAVSFNNGLLKIYNDDFNNRIPINKIQIFEENEEIISLQKSSGNSLLLIGISKIKRINLSQNLLNYKILNEIYLNDHIFKIVSEIDNINGLIIINNLNEILFYNYSKNITSNIPKKNEIEEGKEISFMEAISHNKIILQYNNTYDLIEINTETKSLTINCEDKFNNIKNSNIDTSTSLIINNSLNHKESSKIYWTIYEFEMKDNNNIEIKKSHKFNNDIYYLGKMNKQTIFLFNKNSKKIILFNLLIYSSILEISFKKTKNPLSAFYLNTRKDFSDLLLINEEGYISQYSLNMKLGILHGIEKKQIVENGNKMPNENNDGNGFENVIVKTINLNNNTFLFFSKGNYIYKLKSSN